MTFLGPLCSLMQNSYSVAALTPLGQVYCTYIAGGKAMPEPYDKSAAFHSHVQARRKISIVHPMGLPLVPSAQWRGPPSAP